MSEFTTSLVGENFTHRNLWHTATHLKDMGDSISEGSGHQYKAATVFSMFSFEAYLNYLISKLDGDVSKKERVFFGPKGNYLGIRGKIKWILETLKLPKANFGSFPYQHLIGVINARDVYAHGKPEMCDITENHDAPEHDISPSWYGEAVTKDDIVQTMDCIIEITNQMHAKANEYLGSPLWWGKEALSGPLSYAVGDTECSS